MYSPDRHLRHQLVHIRRMDEDGTAYSFRCPNLDCEPSILGQEVALGHCDTPLLAKLKGCFIHYQSGRFDG